MSLQISGVLHVIIWLQVSRSDSKCFSCVRTSLAPETKRVANSQLKLGNPDDIKTFLRTANENLRKKTQTMFPA